MRNGERKRQKITIRILRKCRILAGLLCIVILCGCHETEKSDEVLEPGAELVRQVEAYISAHVANGRFNGSLLIAKGDSILLSNSYGLANRESNLANTPSTKFLIGSITKPFTAFGILLLEQKGMLSLDDKLSHYFPNFPNAEKISIKQLLNHTSGITDYHAFEQWKADSKRNISPEYTLNTLLERPSSFEPGERFSYTNSGYIFLGLIIEQVSGQSFDQFIQKEICEPIGLNKTGVASNSLPIYELATGYTTTPRETLLAEYINFNQPFASGNMYATTTDLWKFTKAVIHGTLLSAEMSKEIFTGGKGYGYGWGIRGYNGLQAFGHFGAMNGFVGAMTFIPEGEYFICFLTNDDNTPEHGIMEDLVQLVQGQEVSAPQRMKLIPLTKKMKMAVKGYYLLKVGDTLKVYEAENRLYLKETGQMTHELFPIDSLEYTFTLIEFNALFSEPKEQFSDTLKLIGKNRAIATRVKVPE